MASLLSRELELLLLLLLWEELLLLLLLGCELLPLLEAKLLLLLLLLLRDELLLLLLCSKLLLLLWRKLLLLAKLPEVLVKGRLVKLTAQVSVGVEVGRIEDGAAGSALGPLVGKGLPLNGRLVLGLYFLLSGDHTLLMGDNCLMSGSFNLKGRIFSSWALCSPLDVGGEPRAVVG